MALLKKIAPTRIALILVSLFVFVLALTLLKEGAGTLAPWLEETFDLTGIMHSLGFGWFSAIVVLSGSPIAAASLTFFDSGAIHELSALAMIVGSRIGAAFIVFAISLVYIIRRRDRMRLLSTGLLSLVVTATTYLPALPLGIVLLKSGALEWVMIPSESLPGEIVSQLFGPVVQVSVELLTHTGTFFAGLVLIILSFNLFDRALPDLEDDEEGRERLGRYLYRPWVMFIAGAAVTLISLSVTLSLSILVPLTRHRLVRLKYLVPYIMGANITTLVDTLLAAGVMGNPEAVSIVLAGSAAIILISVVIIVAVYHRYENLVLGLTEWAIGNRRNLAISMCVFILTPLVLLLT